MPVTVALRAGVGTREMRSCGMEEAALCAFENLPDALGALLVIGLAILLISVAFAAAGTVLLVMGVARRRRRGRRWVPPTLVATGTALTMPLASLLWALAVAAAT